MKYVTFSEWEDFVSKWYTDYRCKATKASGLVYVTDVKRSRVRITNTKTGKSVVAMCHRNDSFDERVGIAVAWARYNGVEIPKLVNYTEKPKLEAMCILQKFNINDSKSLENVLKNYRNIIDIISSGDCKDIRICNDDLMDYLTGYVNMNIREHTTDYPIRWENDR